MMMMTIIGRNRVLLLLINQKGAITLAARLHNVNVLLSNTTFLIFAVLVV